MPNAAGSIQLVFAADRELRRSLQVFAARFPGLGTAPIEARCGRSICSAPQALRCRPDGAHRLRGYRRSGTVNLFIFLDAHRRWRKVKVTDSRAAVDFAACMRELTDMHFPVAERIRVVLDNLSTHSAGALC
jgi:hypothetical protein